MPKQTTKARRERHEDDPNFRSTASAYDEKRASSASGHDDQGGSRQSEGRDYEKRKTGGGGAATAGSEKPDTGGTHSDARRARERYGEQTPAERRESMRQEQRPQNVGGQHGSDQSEAEKHSLRGRKGEEAPVGEGEPYASDTRDNFSRQYAEYRQREEERQVAAGGGDYDGNWTRDTDKPPQPGPAETERERTER